MTTKPGIITRGAIRIFCLIFIASAAHAAAPLFPTPLHLTREIVDPISGVATVVDEYCHGSRIVSVSGPLTSIADYAKGELVRIDREAGTYSVTRFEEIARIWPSPAARGLGISGPGGEAMTAPLEFRSLGIRGVGGRSAEIFAIDLPGANGLRRVEVGVDSTITLSRDAVEALVGAAWPHPRHAEHDAILGACRSGGSLRTSSEDTTSRDRYRLPLEQILVFDAAGETISFTNVVTRVGSELPPADLIAIPPGATLVEDERIAARRLLDELDRLPVETPRH